MAGLDHGWDRGEAPNHADFIHGGVGEEDFADTFRHVKAAKRDRPKKKPGCPGNDGGPHIYVWTTEYNIEDVFFKFFGFHRTERQYCAGCGKSAKRGSRHTERYVKKFQPVGRWSHPEHAHVGYAAFRKKWMVQHGWTHELYGNW